MGNVCLIDLGLSASEINKRIEEATEPYIGFYEEGSSYKEDLFDKLAGALESHPDVDVARSIVRAKKKRLSIERWAHGDLLKVDTSEDYIRAMIFPCGAVFRAETLRVSGARFNPELAFCRDELFTLTFGMKAPVYLLLAEENYNSPRVFDETSISVPQTEERRWYSDSTLPMVGALEQANPDGADAPLPMQTQYGLLYLLTKRFKANKGKDLKMVFASKEDTEEYLKGAGEVLRHISNEVLFRHSAGTKLARWSYLYLAQLRDQNQQIEFSVEAVTADEKGKPQAKLFLEKPVCDLPGKRIPLCYFTEQRLAVNTLHLIGDEKTGMSFELELDFDYVFPPDTFELYLCNTYDGEEHAVKATHTSMLAGLGAYFDHDVYEMTFYTATVPLAKKRCDQVISAYAIVNGQRIDVKLGSRGVWQSRLRENSRWGYWSIPGYIVRSINNRIHVERAGALRKFAQEKIYQMMLSKNPDTPKGVLELRKEYWRTRKQFEGKTIWTYNDKGYKAGDNAEYALRYAAKQNDGIEKVFFIDPTCPDGIRLKEEGFKVMDPKSIEGRLYALHADVIFMTHVPPYLKLGLNNTRMPYFKDLLHAKIVRLYHGFPITRSPSYTRAGSDCVAVAVGSEYERELYTNSENCYRPEQVIASGMPRYDDLIDDSRKQILFAPTWRPSLTGKTVATGASLHNPAFKDSPYFKLYTQVMNDPRVLEVARHKGYKIKMFLHPKLSAQTVDFEQNDVVEALSCTQDMDYVTIMRQSDLMITDFSSVQYDFAYMRKPVLYYHDPALPYWRVTNFDYEGIGFGEVCRSAEELVTTLCDYMEKDCVLKDMYRNRIEDFFIHSDHNAAKRLYEAALKL